MKLQISTLVLAAALLGAPVHAQTVKVSNLGVLADAPFYIAMEKGYFAAEKIDVAFESFNSAQAAVAPLATNQIQVVGGAVSAALFNAFARDWPVRVVMARARDVPSYSGNALIVRKELQPTVTSLSGLKGLKVALNAPAASMQYMLGKMLDAGGLKLDDVEVIYMPWPDMAAALRTKAIDAGTTVEPFTYEFETRGLAYTLSRSADVLTKPAMEVAILLYNKEWMDKSTDQAQRFSVAYLRGARDFTDALQGGAKRAEVVSILTKYTTIKDVAVYERIGWTWMDPNGEVSLDGLRDQQDFYAATGSVQKKVDVQQMVDRRFLDYALNRLGRVPSKY